MPFNLSFSRGRKPKISVIVVFHNMRREAERTLYAFTTAYQQGVALSDYEVIVVDSNSSEPLDSSWVRNLQSNFRYAYISADAPTPNKAMNAGVTMARAPLVACVIDGARIPSPGVLRWMLDAQRLFGASYVMTLGMHLGPAQQQVSVSDGYCQAVEDRMLDEIDWRSNGYTLFDVSAPAGSSAGGYFRAIAESNCFCCPRESLRAIGGFDERFVEHGGGLTNLHVHNQLVTNPELTPVMLLGEASFHQFHGGVSTNVPKAQSPFERFSAEYKEVVGQPFERQWREPQYIGHMPVSARHYLIKGGPHSG